MPGGRQAGLQPRRRRADPDVPEEPADVARAAFVVLDRHVPCSSPSSGVLARHRAELGAEERGHLARDAVDGQAVGPVAGQLDLEHLLAEREHVAERRPRLVRLGEDEDARVLGAELELGLGQDHPVGDAAAELGPLERPAVRKDGAGKGHRDGRAGAEVPGAADDLAGSASPTSTRQSWSRSAFGCLPASTTRPTR